MAFDYAGAKAAGYSDQEIQSYLASKQKQPEKKSFVQNAADFAAPAMKKFVTAIMSPLTLGAENKAQANLNEQLNIRNKSILDQAANEQDPMKKQQLFQMARQTNQEQANTNIGTQANQMQQDVGMRQGQGNLDFALRTGVGVGTEVGSWVAPVSGLKVGGSKVLGKVGSKVLGTGGTSAVSGGLTALSDNENQELGSVITGAITAAMFGKGTQLVGKAIQSTMKVITSKMPKAMLTKGLEVPNKDNEDAIKAVKYLMKEGKPGNYSKIDKWAAGVGENAEKQLKKIDIPEGFTAQDLFLNPTNADEAKLLQSGNLGGVWKGFSEQKVASGIKSVGELAQDLKSRGDLFNAKQVVSIQKKLKSNAPITFQEALYLKRQAQNVAKFNKPVDNITGQAASRMTHLANNLMLGVKVKSPEAAQLLQLQQYSVILSGLAKVASTKTIKKMIPTILEISAVTGAGLGMASGHPEYAGVAGAAFLGSRALARPGGAMKTYQMASKVKGAVGKATSKAGKTNAGKAAKVVKDYFYRGARREVAKEASDL